MPRIAMSTALPVSAQSVWNVIGGFSALPDWHPRVAQSELSDGGSKRTLQLFGGLSIVEKLESAGEEYIYSCSLLESPLPVKSYTAAVAIKPGADGAGCMVEWSGDYQPVEVPESEATRIVQGLCHVGFDNLKRVLGV